MRTQTLSKCRDTMPCQVCLCACVPMRPRVERPRVSLFVAYSCCHRQALRQANVIKPKIPNSSQPPAALGRGCDRNVEAGDRRGQTSRGETRCCLAQNAFHHRSVGPRIVWINLCPKDSDVTDFSCEINALYFSCLGAESVTSTTCYIYKLQKHLFSMVIDIYDDGGIWFLHFIVLYCFVLYCIVFCCILVLYLYCFLSSDSLVVLS